MNARKNNGFTLIEILVVVGIIALLAGMLTVSLSLAKKAAKMHSTKSTLGMISSGAEMFKNDFGSYPPSELGSSNINFTNLGLSVTDANVLDSGAKIICALLTGYLNDTPTATPDGTFSSWSTDDGAKGFGFRTKARGKVHGPYGGVESAKTEYSGAATAKDTPKVFIDSWNHAILYYRYDTAGNTYNASDNASVTVDAVNSPCPTGAFDTKYAAARKDFLVISAGDVDTTFDWKEAVTNASVE